MDDFCTRVLARHWPDVVKHRDVRHVGAHNLAPVDLIAGGFPCQDISVAGKGAGLDGERSGLWFEFLRIVRDLRPAWVLAENVPALRTRGADVVLAGLEAAGYACWPLVVGARHVGAPHRRDRVWIVAHRERVGRTIEGDGRHTGSRARCDGTSGLTGAYGVADSCSERLREQSGRRSGPCGTEASRPGIAPGSLAHGHGHGREGERRGGLLDGERPTQRNDADGRSLWPSRPGEPQHGWEAPRTVEPPLGGAAHGLSERLAGRRESAHRRSSLKALGNSAVPQVVEAIGRAILDAR